MVTLTLNNKTLNINIEKAFKFIAIGFIVFCLSSWLINLDLTILNRSF